MALSPQDLQHIAQSAGRRAGRVEVIDTTEGKVVVKGLRPSRSTARYRLLNRIARWLGLQFLAAVPMPGGARAQATEVARLRALRHAGARVPEVLHVGEDHFVIQWLGERHLGDVLQARGPQSAVLWREAGDALVQLHAAGQYLSQGFARNMIVNGAPHTPHLAGLIDFEDDPLEVMSLADAQVRDWLAFLHSTLWTLSAPTDDVDTCLDAWMAAETSAVSGLFLQACRKLAWLRHLPPYRRLGRDAVSLQAAAAAAYRYLARHGLRRASDDSANSNLNH